MTLNQRYIKIFEQTQKNGFKKAREIIGYLDLSIDGKVSDSFIYPIIFGEEFCEYYWNQKTYIYFDKGINRCEVNKDEIIDENKNDGYQKYMPIDLFHKQQLVLAKDKLAYLEGFLGGQKR